MRGRKERFPAAVVSLLIAGPAVGLIAARAASCCGYEQPDRRDAHRLLSAVARQQVDFHIHVPVPVLARSRNAPIFGILLPRSPLASRDAPAVRTALGTVESAEGRNDSGIPMIDAVRFAPDTLWLPAGWGDIVKGDAPARERPGRIISLIGILFVCLKASLGVVWRFRRARFRRGRDEARDTLAILKRIGDIFLTVPDEEMFSEVFKIVLEVLQSPFGIFGYVDENGALVVPAPTLPIADQGRISDATIVYPGDEWGDIGWLRAIAEKKPDCANDVVSDRIPEGRVRLKRHLSMPILFRGRVIGLFQVADKETNYTETDGCKLGAIAEYFAPLLNARLRCRRYEEELRAKNDELTRFIYAFSHDLKSPLVTIHTFLGFLEQDARKPDMEALGKDLMYIRTASDKMSRLLDELLELSRIGHKALPFSEAPLQTIVREALDPIAGRIAERGVKVEVTKEPLLLTGDRPRLVEVFQNLVDNAVKFMGDEPAPRVEIGADHKSEATVLFVRDNGIGIDPKHQPKLFGLFEKLDPGTEGSGIGLALVRRIVEVHGGRIWVESEGPHKGATFRFTLAKTRRG